jgi:hypothetical protein
MHCWTDPFVHRIHDTFPHLPEWTVFSRKGNTGVELQISTEKKRVSNHRFQQYGWDHQPSSRWDKCRTRRCPRSRGAGGITRSGTSSSATLASTGSAISKGESLNAGANTWFGNASVSIANITTLDGAATEATSTGVFDRPCAAGCWGW